MSTTIGLYSASTTPVFTRLVPIPFIVVVAVFAACETRRDANDAPDASTSFDQVAPIFQARCLRCHAGSAPAGGWSVDSWVDVIGCNAAEIPVTLPAAPTVTDGGSNASSSSSRPLLLAALDRPDHVGFVTSDERTTLVSWIATGGLRSRGNGVHRRGFADPRSPESHGTLLRAKHYSPMLDPNDLDACGTCHEGAPRPGRATRDNITMGAANAPSCTSCHKEPTGVTACGTCHGDGAARAYPPRSRCFFPGDPVDRTHKAHAEASPSRGEGLQCSACHPAPTSGEPASTHANGYVEVWFDYAVAGREARFNQSTRACTGTCHARGGAREAPAWGGEQAPMTCNDCHGAPPRDHYRGACTSCHQEANATGTALSKLVLHANGKVDLGDGSGRCGSCHGTGDDPWPSTGAHRAHANPDNAKPVACETCHDVPSAYRPAGAHPEGKGSASVRLGGLATHGGRRASYDPNTKTCAGTYCHEGSGGANPAPRWTDGALARTCTSCHNAPPPTPHVQSPTTCAGATCHEGSTTATGLTITATGRVVHVDGKIDRGL